MNGVANSSYSPLDHQHVSADPWPLVSQTAQTSSDHAMRLFGLHKRQGPPGQCSRLGLQWRSSQSFHQYHEVESVRYNRMQMILVLIAGLKSRSPAGVLYACFSERNAFLSGFLAALLGQLDDRHSCKSFLPGTDITLRFPKLIAAAMAMLNNLVYDKGTWKLSKSTAAGSEVYAQHHHENMTFRI